LDIGLTHIALPVENVDRSITFYGTSANMEVVHRRVEPESGRSVVWLSDRTRPFAIVLLELSPVQPILKPFAHLGIGCRSRQEVDRLCQLAQQQGVLVKAPEDAGPPIGYWAFLRDPDGHTLELSYGQEIGLAVDSP